MANQSKPGPSVSGQAAVASPDVPPDLPGSSAGESESPGAAAQVADARANPGLPDKRSAWRTLKPLGRFLYPYRLRIVVAALALLVAATATLAIPVAFRLLIDVGFAESSGPGMSGEHVNSVFLALFGVAVVLAASTALRFYTVAWLGERITTDIRNAVFSRVLHQDPVFFETLKTGEVLSRLSTDTTLIQTLVGTSISLGLRNLLLFSGALVMMIWSNPKLAAIIVALLLLVVVPIMLFGRKVRRLSRDSQDRLADSGAQAGETLGAMQVVQAFGREASESQRYNTATEQAFVSAVTRNRSRALLTLMAIVMVFGAIVFVLWLGANAVIEGRLTAGLLTQFMLYAALVGGSAGALSEVLGDVQRAAGATERLLELLEAQPAIVPGRSTLETHDPALKGEARVAFDKVSFSYPSRPLDRSLKGVSFAVEPGETVALVGPSGAGKTTVLQLLLRFYDVAEGEIRLNDQSLPALTLESLRRQIGLVSQESIVFSSSALENIRYGLLEATDEQVFAAARAAQADEFLRALPQGYDTELGERGVRLSGGQRQRIAIARALLKNPPLLLLDEATSALDAESERAVQLALQQAMTGRTTLVIAHRLATIVNADRIVVLEAGQVIEQGTHRELQARGGRYAELAALQFGLECLEVPA